MHAGLVNRVTAEVGLDYMANVGGAIHGHPGGTKSGATAMRSAIDGDYSNKEYKQAIEKWGLV
jgi:ribulose 1,5-bisphosphate carboxylase large subunit-like protein